MKYSEFRRWLKSRGRRVRPARAAISRVTLNGRSSIPSRTMRASEIGTRSGRADQKQLEELT